MDLGIKFGGKLATAADVEFINNMLLSNPETNRRQLSIKLCKAWNWVQPNGFLRDMVCRGFLLKLERAGYIKLPAQKTLSYNHHIGKKKPTVIEIDQSPIECKLSEIQPLEFRQVRYTKMEKVFNSLVSQYHYLGYCNAVGEQLKYIVFHDNKAIACVSWSSAARHIGSRDKFIGWKKETREKNLYLMAYNSRFLILPWVKVPHLGAVHVGKYLLQNSLKGSEINDMMKQQVQ